MPAWLEYGKSGQRGRFDIGDDPALLGRQRSCAVVLNSESVSRRHAEIARKGDAVTISDLGSRNGTLVNGIPISGPTQLRDRDVITICDCELWFRTSEVGAATDLNVTIVEGMMTPDIVSTLDAKASSPCQVDPVAALQAVVAVTRELGNNLELSEVLPKVLDSVFDIYPHADRGVILLADDDGELQPMAMKARADDGAELHVSRTVVARAMQQREAILSANVTADIQFEPSQSLMSMPIHSLMCVPLLGRDDHALGVIELHTESANAKFTEQCLDLLVSVASAAAIAVENARLHEKTLRQDRLERDLGHARVVQQSFLPAQTPECDGWDFFVHYQAATAVGGDYYGFLELPGDRIAIGVGDVSGKGLPAALMMARLSSDVRFALMQSQDPAEALTLVNRSLAEARLDDRFVTFVLMVLDPASGKVSLANAGHQTPLLRLADGSVELIDGQNVGVPLNVSEDPKHSATTVDLEMAPGSTLLIYTDGLSEAANRAHEQFGDSRVRQVLASGDGGASLVGARLVRELESFVGGAAQRDDTTIVSLGRL